jgi:hypothetical protein
MREYASDQAAVIPAPFNESPSAVPYLTISIIFAWEITLHMLSMQRKLGYSRMLECQDIVDTTWE